MNTLPDASLPPTRKPSQLRVLIADDHPMMVDGLRYLLEAHGYDVICTVGDGQAAVAQANQLQPDLVLMDISMPGLNGLAATRLIKAKQPEIKILIVTTSAEDADLFEAVKSGATGYLLKTTRGPTFIDALVGLEQGIPPFSPGLAELLLHEFARLAVVQEEAPVSRRHENGMKARLNERQAEVLRLVADGLTYKQVGEQLSLSEATVRYHMVEIMHLLHMENRNQVIAWAGELRSSGKQG